ncbi:MAG: NUDIX domain-containing protein [Prolixibacteraceae bacterium]|jgi:8-oxo-dGTP pyrophosphatase MutT (NUDIX family)
MYKVFFNDSIIQIGIDPKRSPKNNISDPEFTDVYSSVNQAISGIKTTQKTNGILTHVDDIFELWDDFRKRFVEIPAAGGLVRNNKGAILFIKRLGVWDLPKGKIEKKETPERAAIREVEEECGLLGLKLVKALDSTYHIYQSPFIQAPENWVLKETKWFLMDYSGNGIPVPQKEEDIVDVQWISASEIEHVLENTYSSLRDFLYKTLPVI